MANVLEPFVSRGGFLGHSRLTEHDSLQLLSENGGDSGSYVDGMLQQGAISLESTSIEECDRKSYCHVSRRILYYVVMALAEEVLEGGGSVVS